MSNTVPPQAMQAASKSPLMRLTMRVDAAPRAMHLLAKAAKLSPRLLDLPIMPEGIAVEALAFDRWMEQTADYYGIEAETIECSFADLEATLSTLGACILRMDVDGEERLLPVLRGGASKLTVVTIGGAEETLDTSIVSDALFKPVLATAGPIIEGWLDRAKVPMGRRPKVRKALILNRLGTNPACHGWLLRLSPAASTWQQFLRAGIVARLGAFLGLTALNLGIGLLEWFILGHGATQGSLPQSSAIGWVLLSFTTIPIQLVSTWLMARIGVDVAAIIKRRLLLGALNLDPNTIRERGSGQLLAMVGESQTIEAAGLASVLEAVAAVVSLITSAVILSLGIGGNLHVALMFVWAVLIGIGTVWAGRLNRDWTDVRLSMTNNLVARMLGHRTRAVQESPRNRHAAEDDELENYVATSHKLDTLQALLSGLPSRGWLAIGFVSMVPALLQTRAEPAIILVTVGGLLSAQGAFAALAGAIQGLLAFGVAWRSVGPLFNAAQLPKGGLPVTIKSDDDDGDDASSPVLLEGKNMSFRYRQGGDPILHRASISIRKGDRILLEGKSGGGKSTLAGMLAGLKEPEAGLLLLRGLDRSTLGGTEWRRRVASVPQFHENHILTGTLAFNVLLGRNWPPTAIDLALATEVLQALGLGPLLERMPSGMDQMLGETGWQLSHGEKSRVFLARALIQDADVVLLDETFGALDPVTMKVCVETAMDRAKALLVIAHP